MGEKPRVTEIVMSKTDTVPALREPPFQWGMQMVNKWKKITDFIQTLWTEPGQEPVENSALNNMLGSQLLGWHRKDEKGAHAKSRKISKESKYKGCGAGKFLMCLRYWGKANVSGM